MDEDQPPQVAQLGSAECWRLLHRSGAGALATAADGQADVFPLNYLVDGKTLLFRTSPGTKVAALEAAPHAAFIAQGQDADGHWSVVMRGTVEMLTDEVEIIGSGALELVSWAAGAKRIFLRLTPARVDGRRVRRADLARSTLYG
jgi:nitroimidazol reductase NimA-like FMN-containing flavoprotein (pyridoxamine 5'-phosphate oxidase superfamily)